MRFIYSFLTLILLLSCSDSNEYEPEISHAKTQISFSVTTEALSDSTQSRGITINHPSNMSEFRIFAPLWDQTEEGYIFRGYEIEDEIVSRGSDNEWTTSIPYYWPQGNRFLTFFAYHPANVDGWRVGNPHYSPKEIRFYYTPPADSRAQHDILFAYNHDMMNYSGEPDKRVKLTFSHILTNIRFKIIGDSTKVKSITLKNFHGSGGYHPEEWSEMYNWDYNNFENTAPAPLVDYTVEIPENGVIGDEQTLIIIPQQARPDSSIEVLLRDGTVLTSPFSYHTFQPQEIRRINIHLPSDSTTAGSRMVTDM